MGTIVFVCLLGLAAAASAKPRVIKHWPDSPVRHLIRARSTNTTPSFSANLRGDTATAGNTLLTCPENVSARRRHRARRGRRAAEPCLGANNNDHNMVYVNVDPSGGHFDSSSATLTVPSDARVVRAILYWGADLARGVQRPPNGAADDAPGGANPNTNTLWKTAQLRVGSGSYSTIDATAAGRDGQWAGTPSWYQQPGQDVGFAYQVRANVTNEVNAGLTATRRRTRSGSSKQVTVTVANVRAGRGYNRHGGWTLLVAWESPTAAFRNITVFDGFEFVQVEGGQQLVVGPLNFTGFTTPASGKVDAHVTSWTYEGDRAITGDYLALGKLKQDDTCTGLPHESDALHPVDNFFNSTISIGGVDIGGRTPNYGNQLGFDLATLNVPEGTIPNDATGASVCLGTVGDTYFFGGIVFDTLIRAPNVQITKVADRTQADPGDAVTYTTSVTNPQRSQDDPLYPTAAATNLVIADPLPSGLDFAGFTSNPNGVCSYDSNTHTINCAVGTLAASGSFTYSFSAIVHASVQGPEPASIVNTGCYQSNSEDQKTVVYNGCGAATVVVPPAPPQPVDLGVVKTVSNSTVAPGDTVSWRLVATNYGPGTSTGFVLADQLPPGVSFIGATASSPLTCTTPAVGSDGAVVCTAPSVPPTPANGSSLTLTIVATVPAGTADGTLLTNAATVRGDQDEPAPDPHPNRDRTLTSVVVPHQPLPPPSQPPAPNPDGPPQPPVPAPPEPPTPDVLGTVLAIHKTASPSHTTPGSAVTFHLRVANIAEDSALNVRACDTLPLGLTVASAPGFRVRGRTLCATLARLKVLTSKTLRFTARVSAGAPFRITNAATARARNAATVRARATLHVTAPPPSPGRG